MGVLILLCVSCYFEKTTTERIAEIKKGDKALLTRLIYQKNINLNSIKQDEVRSIAVWVKNIGNKSYELVNLVPSCNCFDAKANKTKISPNDSLLITVKIPSTDIGESNFSVILCGNSSLIYETINFHTEVIKKKI